MVVPTKRKEKSKDEYIEYYVTSNIDDLASISAQWSGRPALMLGAPYSLIRWFLAD